MSRARRCGFGIAWILGVVLTFSSGIATLAKLSRALAIVGGTSNAGRTVETVLGALLGLGASVGMLAIGLLLLFVARQEDRIPPGVGRWK